MIGVDRIGLYVPGTALRMDTLADALGVPPEKCFSGIGQEIMAVAPPDEDIVTMGAAAARACIEEVDVDSIAAVIISTESGTDHSKAASIAIHRLLELPTSCLCWEVKQACSGSTLALFSALDYIARRPDKRVLVIASDIAVYEHGSPGELTQGAGAVAMLISHSPALLEIFPAAGNFTEDVMDFWRPTYSRTAMVDGRFSIKMYQKALGHCWQEYARSGGLSPARLSRFCFHQPFTRMAEKALKTLERVSNYEFTPDTISASQTYNRLIGNTYSASLFFGLCSLLEEDKEELGGKHIGLFGYGSGAVASFYGGRILPGYREHLAKNAHEAMLSTRTMIDFSCYRNYTDFRLVTDGSSQRAPEVTTGPFRLAGIDNHIRIYETNQTGLHRSSNQQATSGLTMGDSDSNVD